MSVVRVVRLRSESRRTVFAGRQVSEGEAPPAYHSAMAPLRTVTGSVVGLRLVVQSGLRWTWDVEGLEAFLLLVPSLS
jgi:hypothetical protein